MRPTKQPPSHQAQRSSPNLLTASDPSPRGSTDTIFIPPDTSTPPLTVVIPSPSLVGEFHVVLSNKHLLFLPVSRYFALSDFTFYSLLPKDRRTTIITTLLAIPLLPSLHLTTSPGFVHITSPTGVPILTKRNTDPVLTLVSSISLLRGDDTFAALIKTTVASSAPSIYALGCFPAFGIPLLHFAALFPTYKNTGVPRFIFDACVYLEAHLNVQGIFRMSGDSDQIKTLRRLVSESAPIDFSKFNIHSTTNLLKSFFRDMKVLLTAEQQAALVASLDADPSLADFKCRVAELPLPVRNTLNVCPRASRRAPLTPRR